MKRQSMAWVMTIGLSGSVGRMSEIPAAVEMARPCDAVERVALPFFAERGLMLVPDKMCVECFRGETMRLRDAKGKTLNPARAMREDMEATSRRSNPIIWYSHSVMTTTAHLGLRSTASGCSVSLLFGYRWYGAQFMLIVPVDGDLESRRSNLRLEKEYLDGITGRVGTGS